MLCCILKQSTRKTKHLVYMHTLKDKRRGESSGRMEGGTGIKPIRASSIDFYKCLCTVESVESLSETVQASGTLPANVISTVTAALITVMSNLTYAP